MTEFFCIGISHQTCPVELREKLAISEKKLPQVLGDFKVLDGLRECLVLSTCNRVEFYGRGDAATIAEMDQHIANYYGIAVGDWKPVRYLLRGQAVFSHLFRVSCGLESMVVGENEIHGQLKRAFHAAWEADAIDSFLYQLVERALRVGKKARTETHISRGAVSVASVAAHLAEKIFGKLTGEEVLIIGTGEMSERMVEHLMKTGAGKITVTSRSYERALGLAQKFGAIPLHYNEWMRALRASDIVITSTSAPHLLIRYDDIKPLMQERRNQPLFFIDISVPRNVDPRLQSLDDVYLYDIDDLQSVISSNVRERKKEIEKCETLIEQEILQFSSWIEQLQMKPVIQHMQQLFDEAAEYELKRFQHVFQGKDAEVRDIFTRIRKKMFHKPMSKLRHASKEGTLFRYLQVIRELFTDDTHPASEVKAVRSEENES